MMYVLVVYLLIGAVYACINGINMALEKCKQDKDYEDWIKTKIIDESRFYEVHLPSPYTKEMIMLISVLIIVLWPIRVATTLYCWLRKEI